MNNILIFLTLLLAYEVKTLTLGIGASVGGTIAGKLLGFDNYGRGGGYGYSAGYGGYPAGYGGGFGISPGLGGSYLSAPSSVVAVPPSGVYGGISGANLYPQSLGYQYNSQYKSSNSASSSSSSSNGFF